MIIEILYDNSDEAMYGSDEEAITEVDYEASEASFESKLEAALKASFPEAEIIIRPGHGSYRVNGRADNDEAITVGEIVHNTWESFDWVCIK